MKRMMKYCLLLVLFAGVCISCEQEISSVQADSFIKFYGSNLMDQAGEVKVLDNGGYAICGTETSASNGKRMVLIVTDEFGNVQGGFPKYYVEDGLETGGTSLIALKGGSGGFILTGFVERPVDGSQQMQKDIFVVRAAASGLVSWQKSYGSLEDEQVLHSTEMIGPGYLLAGYQMKNGYSGLMVMGLTEEGDSIRLGLKYQNPDGRNASAGFLLNTGDMYLCACTYDKADGQGTGIQILSFDNDLSPLVKNLSGENDESGMCIMEEADGHFLVLGNRERGSGAGEVVLYGIETDGLLITNSSLRATVPAVNADLRGERIIETASGDLAITGTRSTGSGSEVLLQFISSSYQVGEGLFFGASGAQAGKDIALTGDGGFVVLGTNTYGEGSIISLMKTNENGEI